MAISGDLAACNCQGIHVIEGNGGNLEIFKRDSLNSHVAGFIAVDTMVRRTTKLSRPENPNVGARNKRLIAVEVAGPGACSGALGVSTQTNAWAKK